MSTSAETLLTEITLAVLRDVRNALREGDLDKIGTYYAEAVERQLRPFVNSHDALLAACEAALDHADKQSDGHCDCHICEQLRAAIKLGKGQG